MFEWLRASVDRFLGAIGRRRRPTPETRWTRPVFDIAHWTGVDRPPPMSWKDCHPRTRATFKAEMTCSHGHAVSLRGHAIDEDGLVSPSVVCLAPGCDFHDYVRLSDWTSGRL